MANKIVKIGELTTNLLSNDNLIVYKDLSMKSKFNAAATSTTVCPVPDESEYLVALGIESNEKNIGILIDNNNGKKGLLFLANDRYTRDLLNYSNKQSLSKFKVEKNINVKAVQGSLHNIFTWIPGERILNPEFGSTLYRMLYSGITDYNVELIIAEIRKCISEWEPRVNLEQVKNISTVDDTENNTVHLEIIYTIPSLNDKQYSYTYVYHKQTI